MKLAGIELTKKTIIIALLTIVFLGMLIYFFYPRNLGDICHCPSKIEKIDITDNHLASAEDTDAVNLYTDDAGKLINAINNTRVYKNPLYKKLDDVGNESVNLYIHFKTKGHVMKVPLKIHVLTDNILVVDGVQYRIYGSNFIEVFNSLIS
ncbi:MAG: hypothetical protein IKL36_08150 [Clostridia bacterium]|nr:hypothetical protein [Clostridia bacterium]